MSEKKNLPEAVKSPSSVVNPTIQGMSNECLLYRNVEIKASSSECRELSTTGGNGAIG